MSELILRVYWGSAGGGGPAAPFDSILARVARPRQRARRRSGGAELRSVRGRERLVLISTEGQREKTLYYGGVYANRLKTQG